MLGVRPLHGRAFRTKTHGRRQPRGARLLSRVWKQKFGGDPNVIGRVLEMNNRPHTIVGVLPDFRSIRRQRRLHADVGVSLPPRPGGPHRRGRGSPRCSRPARPASRWPSRGDSSPRRSRRTSQQDYPRVRGFTAAINLVARAARVHATPDSSSHWAARPCSCSSSRARTSRTCRSGGPCGVSASWRCARRSAPIARACCDS